ncbi:hypothetical protein CHS0354_033083 [Potamilus streckersoni]|uniref:Uncharacterized protein n=1 Tax=Potamilus streckersoni TaxID=2493646 RepID=A0AAE0RZ21_9BIVA|nr:hypothetical protein CHS0354_033083 [Potamilus streckersoni]
MSNSTRVDRPRQKHVKPSIGGGEQSLYYAINPTANDANNTNNSDNNALIASVRLYLTNLNYK